MDLRSPMLASAYDPKLLTFPRLASPKMDGIRAHVCNGVVYSRSGKPIRNLAIQAALGRAIFNGMDGELAFGPVNAPDVYIQTSSGVMSIQGHPTMGKMDFDFHVFDSYANPDEPFTARMARVERWIKAAAYPHPDYCPNLKPVDQTVINSLEDLDEYEAARLAEGYEGVMLRKPDSLYKFGRSTVREGALLKVKRFAHDEAEVIGFDELMHNSNEVVRDELGRAFRSEHKDGLVPSGMLGAYIVRDPKFQKDFNVSCGSMSHDERTKRWEERDKDLGKIVRYRHLPKGAKDVPRHTLYDGFRDADDL